ncbi:MAG: PEP-CTERM sorting domain-containing protein [Spirulina sp.]
MPRLISSATLSAAALVTAVVSAAVANPAHAIGFTDSYAPENFILENVDTDGSFDLSDIPNSLVIIGGNNGTGVSGSTRYLTTAVASGLVSFDWLYKTTDPSATYDPFGYWLNNAFTQLTNNSLSTQDGNAVFSVQVGDRFGFGINTQDNLPASASVTISNFIAPETTPAAVPTPALGFGLVGMGIAALRQRLAQD